MQYRHTFFNVETGGQMTRRVFLEGEDVMKKGVFLVHKSHRLPIRDKVAAWVNAGWATWEEEKPDWFTDQWKASVPEDMKPAKKTGDVDDGDKMAAENEGGEALTVGGEEEQNGRRRSIVDIISGQKAGSSKVMPAGGSKYEIDVKEFEREMKRRGPINM